MGLREIIRERNYHSDSDCSEASCVEAAVPTPDSNSPVDMSSWQNFMMVDVYVAIAANLARSAALLRC